MIAGLQVGGRRHFIIQEPHLSKVMTSWNPERGGRRRVERADDRGENHAGMDESALPLLPTEEGSGKLTAGGHERAVLPAPTMMSLSSIML
jgi:hypothetical protein